jgi:carbamoyl-phosphate synthase small subunit
MKPDKALLLLEDGTAFEGIPFGAQGEAMGEALFYTGVVGYQEVLTDPSYRGTLVTLTYPIIGSYGVNAEDNESPCAQARGVVVRDYSTCVSNFRATGTLEDFLAERGVVGIRDIDTRAVAVHLRDHGEMRGLIASGEPDRGPLLEKLKAAPSPFGTDLVEELPAEPSCPAAGAGKHRVVALHLGIKRSLLAQLVQLGCSVDILPATASAKDVLARKAGGVLLPGGPGDPRALGYVVETARALLGKLPILGVGLGHQLLALALGCAVKRMKVGHHGVNYPVRCLDDKRCDITAQHHSFVVDDAAIPAGVEVTHRNVNDQTVEGIRSRERQARGVQFHPSPDEMGKPSKILGRFLEGEK